MCSVGDYKTISKQKRNQQYRQLPTNTRICASLRFSVLGFEIELAQSALNSSQKLHFIIIYNTIYSL